MLQMSGAKRSAQRRPSQPWRCCWRCCRTLSQKFGPVSRLWLLRFNDSTNPLWPGPAEVLRPEKVPKRPSGRLLPASRLVAADPVRTRDPEMPSAGSPRQTFVRVADDTLSGPDKHYAVREELARCARQMSANG